MSEDDQDLRDELRALLQSGHVTWPTRKALEQRLVWRCQPSFFDPDEFTALRAVARRLVPHDLREMDLACAVDDRLSHGQTDGWRFADAPPDGQAYRDFLRSLPSGFAEFGDEDQDEQLRAMGRAMPHVFEDLLAELTELYYSHPLGQLRIGYVGFADAPRWEKLGLGELDEREKVYGHVADAPPREE